MMFSHVFAGTVLDVGFPVAKYFFVQIMYLTLSLLHTCMTHLQEFLQKVMIWRDFFFLMNLFLMMEVRVCFQTTRKKLEEPLQPPKEKRFHKTMGKI